MGMRWDCPVLRIFSRDTYSARICPGTVQRKYVPVPQAFFYINPLPRDLCPSLSRYSGLPRSRGFSVQSIYTIVLKFYFWFTDWFSNCLKNHFMTRKFFQVLKLFEVDFWRLQYRLYYIVLIIRYSKTKIVTTL